MSVTHYSGIAHAKAGVAYRTFYKHMQDDKTSRKKVLNCHINNLTTEEVLEKLNNFSTGSDIKISNELIKRLSITVTKLGGTIDDKSNKTIIESVDKQLPDPDYKNTTIKANANKIRQITKTIAKIINDDIFTTKVIDTNAEIPTMLRDINIYLYDLSYTINNELSQSKLVITNTIDKLNSLNELVEDHKLNQIIKDLHTIFDTIDANKEIINKEIDNHTKKFKHINEDLSDWDDESKDDKLRGDTIARLLSTIKHVITITYLNNTILSSISTELPKVKDIYKVLRSINKNSKDNFKIVTQVDSIKNYFTNRNAIVGGGIDFDFASEVATSVSGGAGQDPASFLEGGAGQDPASFLEGGARIQLEGMTPEALEKMKKKDRAKEAVREYVSEMNVDINEFVENVYEASKYMGVTTYDTAKLKDHLEDMKWVEGLRDPNIYLAMVGYYLDDTYRAMAGQYEDRLEKTARGLKELGKHLPGTSTYLNKASANISNIIKTVDHFQDLLKTLLVGVCLEDIRDVVADMPHAMGNIHLAINRLYHALNISQMRRMVKKCSNDLSCYTKNYPELLALTVGGRRADLEREYQMLTADCPKGQGSITDPLTGKRLEFDPTAGPGGVTGLIPGVGQGLPDAEAKARLLAETLSPGGILLTRCSLIWRYRNLADSRDAFPAAPVATTNLEYLLKSPDYLQNFDKFLKEVEGEFRAKHRIYKALESLDLLLSVFTKEVAGDIDLMKEVKKYLEDTKVYTKWFTDYTGDLLAAIFESMPAYVNAYDKSGGLGYEALKEAGKAPDWGPAGITTFNYPNATVASTGCELGSPEYNTLSQDLKNPVCISFYYKQLANTCRQSGGYPVYGKATGVACMKGATRLRKNIDEFYNNFQALKNIFHSFITLYNRIISRGVKSKSLMTPSQIYYSILSYLKQSSFARRLQPGDENCHNLCEGSLGFRGQIDDPHYPACIPFRTSWYTSLVGMILPGYYPTRKELACYSIDEQTGYPNNNTGAPASGTSGNIPDWPANQADKQYRNNIANTYKSVYETEDRLCAMGIKSIASVVLSCMGLFTIQQQPVNMGLQKTVRGIIGGGGKSEATGGLLSLTTTMGDDFRDPNTICATANCNLFDSYYYVVRLCEFYKMLFKNMMDDEKECQGAMAVCQGNLQLRRDERYDCKIRLPINLEGDFGKILYIVANNHGIYGDRDACLIINQINRLSSKYRTVDDMLCALISDVNRRFSCVLDEEAQWKFEGLGDRLITNPQQCGDTLSTLGASYCKKTGCKARGSQKTGSMPFEDEHPDDSDLTLLDDTITPSDALMDVAEKYIGFNSQISGCRTMGPSGKPMSITQERNVAKLNFCGEFKLFHKLARMRAMLDEMFDEYLRTQYDSCRDGGRGRTLKHFPLSTDFYRESFHEDFVDQMKMRCHAAKGCKKTAFVVATDLLNSKGRGTIDDKLGGNRDTLFAFTETVGLMTNCLYNTRNILRTCLEDVATFSGEKIYHDFKDKTLPAALIGGGAADFFVTYLNAAATHAGVAAPGALTGDRLDQLFDFEAAGGAIQTSRINTLYMIVLYHLITERGGVRLLGIGNRGNMTRMKDCIYSLWVCKPEMRPYRVAKSIVLGGQYTPGATAPQIPGQPPVTTFTYAMLPQDKKAQLIKETINQMMIRFDLTAVQSNSIGTIARLSSSLDGLVSTTISTQGTFMDITPVESLVIDCMGELKNYASRFYDVLPSNTMAEYYHRSAPGTSGKRSSIYDLEYDFTTYFEPHVTDQIKRLPLIAVVNNTMTTVHKSLVGDLRSVLYQPDQITNSGPNNDLSTQYGATGAGWRTVVEKFSNGGNSIVNAIMPNHYEPHPINISNDLISLSGGNVLGSSSRYVDLFKQFTGTRTGPGTTINNPCLQNICSDFQDVDWTNVNLIDSISNGDNIEALLPAFNHGIRSMLVSFYDYGTRKIYKGVLDMFMTDKLSQNVENLDTSYPDIYSQRVNAGDHIHLAMPQPGSILCTSIAVILRLLFTSVNNRTQVGQFTYDSLSEIKNTTLVEVMKLKLPMFKEYFIKLVNKCRVIRGFLTKGCGSRENKRRLISVTQPFNRLVGGIPGEHVVYTLQGGAIDNVVGAVFNNYINSITIGDKIQLAGLTDRDATVNNVVGAAAGPPTATNVQPLDAKLGGHEGRLSDDTLYSTNTSDEWRYGYFMELISNIEDSCISIANQCDNLLGEFTAEDQYMIPGLEYLDKHKKKYNHPTFRPLSLTSAFTSVIPAFKGLHNLNSRREGSAFKLQYGAKGILFSDDMKFLNSKYLEPIMCAIREGTKSSTVRIDTSGYGKYAKNYLSLFRFNYSVLNYSQICAVAGDYKSAEFQGGEIAGGGVPEDIMRELLNKYDLSQAHIPGNDPYQKNVPQGNDELPLLNLGIRDIQHVDGKAVVNNIGYTCRKMKTSSPANRFNIWLLEYLHNFIQSGDGNSSNTMSHSSLIRRQFTNVEAQMWINNFNAGGDVVKLDSYVQLYNLYNIGDLTSGRDLAAETLQEAGPSVIRVMHNNAFAAGIPNNALLNIDGRNYDLVYEAIKNLAPTVRPNMTQIGNVQTTNAASSVGTRYDSVAHFYGFGPPGARTYDALFRLIQSEDAHKLARYLANNNIRRPDGAPTGFSSGEKTNLVNALNAVNAGGLGPPGQAMLSKYNLPVWDGAQQIWNDGGKTVATAPAPGGPGAVVPITGGTLVESSIYNLMRSKALGGPSGLIYTATPIATPELLLNIITGDDVQELIEVMTETVSSGSGDNVGSATQCGQQAVMSDDSEQRGSLIAMLIEKNLNPINVHSMQRFIPFANIYNYSYTLDRFIYTMYNIQMPWMDIIHSGYGSSMGGAVPARNEHCTKPGQQIMCFKNIFQSTDPSWTPGRVNNHGQWGNNPNMPPRSMLNLDISSTYYADIVKETFIRMMMDPYAHIDQFVYGTPVGRNAMGANFGPVTRMMRGFDRLGMGIPKFLSDQLLTKSLLSSMYLGRQAGNSVECSAYRWNLDNIANLPGAAAFAAPAPGPMLPGPQGVPLAANVTRRVQGGVPDSPIGPARGFEFLQHQIGTAPPGLAAPVSLPIGRDIPTWPRNEQDHVLPGLHGTSAPDMVTLSDSGLRPWTYGVDAIDQDPAKQELVVNQLPFYDPDTRQVLSYDLGRVFNLSPAAIGKTNVSPPIMAGTVNGAQQDVINMFRYEGYERFNTQLVRNIVFITNLQRMMRYSLNMWLSRAYGAVSRDHQALSAEVTERRLGNSMSITDDREYEDVQQSWI